MADVKAEVKPEIKLDPAEDRKLADLDEFDDDTDLHIPPTDAQAWLVKLPKDMWQAWNDVYQDAPEDKLIEVGKMRVYHQKPDEEDVTKQKIQIRLHDLAQHGDIPKNYDLKLTTHGYSNSVVFSEKDLPGHHRAQPFGRNSRYQHLQPAKPSGIQAKNERYGNGNGNTMSKDGRPSYRTAIPKQTALAPMIHHEANATPIEDDAYYAHVKRKWDAHVAPKSRVTYIEGVDRGMHPGLTNLNSNSMTFGSLSSRPGVRATGGRNKVVKEKAVRMGQPQLIDALYRCFRRYKYWSMKALRNELKQPEAFIKENLETIATLMRSGDFAQNWVLRPEYAMDVVKVGDEVKEEVAKVESGAEMSTADEMGGEEEYEGEGFEDVKMGGKSAPAAETEQTDTEQQKEGTEQEPAANTAEETEMEEDDVHTTFMRNQTTSSDGAAPVPEHTSCTQYLRNKERIRESNAARLAEESPEKREARLRAMRERARERRKEEKKRKGVL